MDRAFLLLLLLEQVSSLNYPLREYYYVDIAKPWYEAREYCRENYDDLAIFDNTGDFQLLSKPAGFSSVYAWIGLQDEPAHWRPNMGNSTNSWVWSATGKPSRTGYQNFNTPDDEPSNYAARELCVVMNAGGAWHDVLCSDGNTFVCFTETGSEVSYTYVSSTRSWPDAVAYCRAHHTDLAMIEDEATNTEVINARPARNTWIGLSRKPWHWVDGSPLTFNSWQGGAPTNYGYQYCVAEDNDHKWMAAGCLNTNLFICHKVNSLVNKVKVNFLSSVNLADPDVQTQILQQLEAELRARGFVSKLSFSIKPQTLN